MSVDDDSGAHPQPPAKQRKVNLYGIGKMALQGVAGAALCILAVKLFEVIEERQQEYNLNVPTENFDKTGLRLFHRLQKWAKFDQANYEKCIQATDSLLQIEVELQKSNAQVDVEDIVRAETFFKVALSYLYSFLNTIQTRYQKEVKPQESVQIGAEVDLIERYLGAHLVSVYSLTTFI